MKRTYLKPICEKCNSLKWYKDARLCYNCGHLPKGQTTPYIEHVRDYVKELKEN